MTVMPGFPGGPEAATFYDSASATDVPTTGGGPAESAYSFVTVQNLIDYMSGIGLEVDQKRATQGVLDGLQRQLERYCQRKFERKWRTETALVDDLGRVWVEATPVVEVGDGPYRLVGRTIRADQYWSANGVDPTYVEITYLGGLDPENDDLQDVALAILAAAAPVVTTRHDDVLDPNDLQARRVDPADRQRKQAKFSDDELAAFDRLRRRTIL